jgi:hydrogenase maturation factor HypF (carbamoyltransferase family)
VVGDHEYAALAAAGHEPVSHRVVPPNDGGMALGQIILARESLRGR